MGGKAVAERNYEKRSTQWLVDALLSDDRDEVNGVRDHLLQQFGPEIARYLHHQLRRRDPTYAEDAYQQTWMNFYEYLLKQSSVQNIGGLLQTIATQRFRDVLRAIKRDDDIENNLRAQIQIGDEEDSLEDTIVKAEFREYFEPVAIQ